MTVSAAGFEVTVEEVRSLTATAWIPSNIFASFAFRAPEPAVFELSLDTLLMCLNIFGSAGSGPTKMPAAGGKRRRWAGDGDEPEEEEWAGEKRKERRTGMRLAWAGEGYPVKVLL